MKKITDQAITYVDGTSWKTAEKDEDGELVIVDAAPRMVPGKTRDAIKIAMFNVPSSIHRVDDDLRVPQMWNQLDRDSVDGCVLIKDKAYKWFHALLKRKVPLTAKEKADSDDKTEPKTWAARLWGSPNGLSIANQLKDVNDRKDTLDDEDEDDEDDE